MNAGGSTLPTRAADWLRAYVLAVLLLLAWAAPCHAHGFLLIDVDISVPGPDGGLSIAIVTNREEFAQALVRSGQLREDEVPAPGDDEAWAALAPRLAALALGRLGCVSHDGSALGISAEGRIEDDRLIVALRIPNARSGISARLALHPGHAPPPAYRLLYAGSADPRIAHEGDAVELAAPAPPEPLRRTIARFLRQGFVHVLPSGLDHLLFVLGLFLLGGTPRRLIGLVTGFTLAHSLTLALAATGILPAAAHARIIETTIALSLVAVAIEAACRPADVSGIGARLRAYAIVIVFGLVHGLGFASALAGIGLPRHQLLPALVAFNVGVEAAQLTILASAWLLIGWARKRTWYRFALVWPACAGIAGCGLVWAIKRLSA